MNIPENVSKYNGKKGSAHIWVVYDMNKDEFIEILKGKMEGCKNIKDTKLRSVVNDIYFNLISALTSDSRLVSPLNIVAFSHPTNTDIVNLTKTQIKLLKEYKCRKYISRSDNSFDLEWLDNYLNDDWHLNVVSVVNHTFSLRRLGKTKSVCTFRSDNKDMTIDDFIEENIPKGDYIITGSSVKLKNFKPTKSVIFFSQRVISDEQILERYEKMQNEKSIVRAEEIIAMVNNVNMMDRVVFGRKDIGQKLPNGYLEEVYCYRKLYNKLLILMKEENIKVGTVIVPIDRDPRDKRTLLLKDYGGIIGLSYDWAKSL